MPSGKFEALRFEITPQKQVTKQRGVLQSFNREVRADRMGPNPGYKKDVGRRVQKGPRPLSRAKQTLALDYRPKGVVSAQPKRPTTQVNNEFARKARMEELHARVRAEKQRAAGNKANPVLTKAANREFSR